MSMPDTTTSAVLTGVITIIGRWSQKQPNNNLKIYLGLTVYAIFLAVIGQMDEKLGRSLGLIGVIAALFVSPGSNQPYIISIAKSAGWSA